jgi:predicted transcriptional regulator
LRRNRLEIVQSILDIARKGATKTQIVYRANLNFRMADELLARLLRAGYVNLERSTKRRPRFLTTERGMAFLQEVERFHGLLTELFSAVEPLAISES